MGAGSMNFIDIIRETFKVITSSCILLSKTSEVYQAGIGTTTTQKGEAKTLSGAKTSMSLGRG